MLSRHVPHLQWVLRHLEELPARRGGRVPVAEATGVDELPLLGADSGVVVADRGVAAVGLEEEGAVRPARYPAFQEREEAAAVQLQVSGLLYTAGVQQRWQEVDVRGDAV